MPKTSFKLPTNVEELIPGLIEELFEQQCLLMTMEGTRDYTRLKQRMNEVTDDFDYNAPSGTLKPGRRGQ